MIQLQLATSDGNIYTYYRPHLYITEYITIMAQNVWPREIKSSVMLVHISPVEKVEVDMSVRCRFAFVSMLTILGVSVNTM